MTRWDSKKTRKHRPQWKCTEHVEDSVKKVRGLLETLGLEKKIKIA